MQVQLIQDESELLQLTAPWSGLSGKSPMLAPSWLMLWWKHYQRKSAEASGEELFVLSVTDKSGSLIGLAPWYLAREKRDRRVIKFLGSGPVCSDHLSILCAPGHEQTVAREIVLFLFEDSVQDEWDEFHLDGVDQDEPVMQYLIDYLKAEDNLLVCVRNAISTWHLPLPDSWDKYLNSLSKNRRKRLRRLKRAYFDTGRAEYHVLRHDADFDEYFESLVTLHNKRRHYFNETGAFECPQFYEFHRRAMKDLLSRDRLHCSLLSLDGEPVAAEYLLKQNDTLYAYQSGLDPAALPHSAGTLSLLGTFHWAIQAGIQNFDFLRGDEAYKTNWAASPRATVRIRVRQRNLMGHVQHLLDQLKQQIRQFRKPTPASDTLEEIAESSAISDRAS